MGRHTCGFVLLGLATLNTGPVYPEEPAPGRCGQCALQEQGCSRIRRTEKQLSNFPAFFRDSSPPGCGPACRI